MRGKASLPADLGGEKAWGCWDAVCGHIVFRPFFYQNILPLLLRDNKNAAKGLKKKKNTIELHGI